MPWSYPEHVPPPARGWDAGARRRCTVAANAVLARGGTEADAVHACIRAAGKSRRLGKGLMLLVKAGPLKGRPGLSLRELTDKRGHRTRRWTRTAGESVSGQDPLLAGLLATYAGDGEVSAQEIVEAVRQYREVEARYRGTPAWMKALNGQPTRLTERQWVLVRTPNFMRWFGDWESLGRRTVLQTMPAVAITDKAIAAASDVRQARELARQAYSRLPKATTRDGREVSFPVSSFKETAHHAADRRVLRVVPQLADLLPLALPLWSDPAANPRKPNIRAYHHYGVRADFDGQQAYVRLVLREDVDGNVYYDNDATSVEALDETKAPVGARQPDRQPKPGEDAEGLSKNRLATWWRSVNSGAVSKVLDENGEPLVVYHGTEADLSRFDDAFLGRQTKAASARLGHFFTTHHGRERGVESERVHGASVWAGAVARYDQGADSAWYPVGANIQAVFLAIRSPYVATHTEMAAAHYSGPAATDALRHKAIQGGADGILYGDRSKSSEESWYIAFSGKAAKSATGNIGTFRPDLDHILKARPLLLLRAHVRGHTRRGPGGRPVLAKAVLLLAKAGPLKGRPGLSLRELTDKRGRRARRWTRTAEESAPGQDPLLVGLLATYAGDGEVSAREITEAVRQYREVEARYRGTPAWMKAPNGQPTRLTERQWVLVRTPNFKRWFGDWRAATLPSRMRDITGSDQARKAAQAFLNRPLVNAETGHVATVSGVTLGKMTSGSAAASSISPQAHMMAVANLDRLFEVSTLRMSRPDADGAAGITAWHHFDAPMPFGGRVLRAKLLVKEMERVDQGSRIYTVAAVEIDEAHVDRGDSTVLVDQARLPHPPVGFDDRMARLVAAVKGEGVSKVLDENGEPQVVYHGTSNDFTAFNIAGGEAYFTEAPTTASQYGEHGNVMLAYLLLKNPAPYSLVQRLSPTALRARGYDGYFEHWTRYKQPDNDPYTEKVCVVFAREQIKSAAGNIGTFRPDLDHILKARPILLLRAYVRGYSRRGPGGRPVLVQPYTNRVPRRPRPDDRTLDLFAAPEDAPHELRPAIAGKGRPDPGADAGPGGGAGSGEPARWAALARSGAIGPALAAALAARAAAGAWPEAFQDQLAAALPALPDPVRAWMERRAGAQSGRLQRMGLSEGEPDFPLVYRATLEAVPPELRAQYRQAAAITVNGTRIEFWGDRFPSTGALTHELVHLAWLDLWGDERRPGAALAAVERARDAAIAYGEQLLAHASSASYRTARPAEGVSEIAWHQAKSLRALLRALPQAHEQGQLRAMLEIELMVPSDRAELAASAGLAVEADGQYVTLAVYAAAARRAGLELPDDYGLEEIVAYRAQSDPAYARDLFGALLPPEERPPPMGLAEWAPGEVPGRPRIWVGRYPDAPAQDDPYLAVLRERHAAARRRFDATFEPMRAEGRPYNVFDLDAGETPSERQDAFREMNRLDREIRRIEEARAKAASGRGHLAHLAGRFSAWVPSAASGGWDLVSNWLVSREAALRDATDKLVQADAGRVSAERRTLIIDSLRFGRMPSPEEARFLAGGRASVNDRVAAELYAEIRGGTKADASRRLRDQVAPMHDFISDSGTRVVIYDTERVVHVAGVDAQAFGVLRPGRRVKR